jgi:hypothetical protein
VDPQVGVPTPDGQATARAERGEGAIDEEVRSPVEAEILKVDSRQR